MRDKGLIFAWALLLLTAASGALYAELTYDGAGRGGVGAGGSTSASDRGGALAVDATASGADTGRSSAGQGASGENGPAAGTPGRASEASRTAPVAAPPPRVAFANAPPISGDARPRLVVIMSEIGLSRARSREAIERLPAAVTMAVIAYADDRDAWIEDARVIGHEVLVAAPMEPVGYPRVDPGPNPLLIDMDDLENLARYDRALAGVSGVVGVLAHMGDRFLADRARLRPILASTQDRGLIFVDNRASPESAVADLAAELGLHVLLNDRFIDAEPSRAAIAGRLAELERIAERRGQAVGIATPYPVSIEAIRRWAEEVEARGFLLTPVSAAAHAPRQ